MARKRTPTAATPTAASGIYLDDDEQLVEEVTTTKKIGRQKRPPEADAEPEAVEIDAEVIEPEPDIDDTPFVFDDANEPPFSDTSLAAKLTKTETRPFEDAVCTIAIRRKPDQLRDKFVIPCNSLTHLPRLANISLSTDVDEVHDIVRKQYNGGHYYFQIFYGGRLRDAWDATLADLPGWTPPNEPTDTPTQPPTPTMPPTPTVDPLTAFIDNLQKTQQLRGLLFGDREAEYQRQIDDLKREIEASRSQPSEPPSERLLILDKALSASGDVQTRLLKNIFPDDDGRHWIADVLEIGMQYKTEIVEIASGLLRGIFAPPQTPIMRPATAPPNIDALLRSAPPPTADTLHPSPSHFRRKAASDTPDDAEPFNEPLPDQPDTAESDAIAIDAETEPEPTPND